MPQIRIITFDLDDTLWEAAPVLMAASKHVHRFLTSKYPKIKALYPTESMLSVVLSDAIKNNPEIAHDFTKLREYTIEKVAREAGLKESKAIAKVAVKEFLGIRSCVTLFPTVLPLLKRLRERGYILGSVTNGNADASIIPGLSTALDFFVRAEDAGASKESNSKCFELALEKALVIAKSQEGKNIEMKSIGLENILHIGDSFKSDVIGAKNVGCASIWFNRNNTQSEKIQDSDTIADGVVYSLDELDVAIEKINE